MMIATLNAYLYGGKLLLFQTQISFSSFHGLAKNVRRFGDYSDYGPVASLPLTFLACAGLALSAVFHLPASFIYYYYSGGVQ